jgi:hypothetical protein
VLHGGILGLTKHKTRSKLACASRYIPQGQTPCKLGACYQISLHSQGAVLQPCNWSLIVHVPGHCGNSVSPQGCCLEQCLGTVSQWAWFQWGWLSSPSPLRLNQPVKTGLRKHAHCFSQRFRCGLRGQEQVQTQSTEDLAAGVGGGQEKWTNERIEGQRVLVAKGWHGKTWSALERCALQRDSGKVSLLRNIWTEACLYIGIRRWQPQPKDQGLLLQAGSNREAPGVPAGWGWQEAPGRGSSGRETR